MINISDLNILDKNKPIYHTSNDTHILYEENEYIVNSSNYKLLGFLNGFSYSNNEGYLLKSTLDGIPIHQIYVDVDNATFIEGMSYAYFFKDNILYKITENMSIEWEEIFDDTIRQVLLDKSGNIYILFENSRTIMKYDKNNNPIVYINDSDNPSNICKIYCGYLSEGGSHLYINGIEWIYGENQYISFIDHYDTRTYKKIDRVIKNYYDYTNKYEVGDEKFSYSDMCVDGDYIYLYGRSYIEKFNIKMRLMWRFYAYDFDYTGSLNNIYMDSFHNIVYDNNRFKDRIYFCSSIDVNNKKCALGKLSLNGNLLWKIIDTTDRTGLDKVEYNICIYNDEIYMTTKDLVDAKSSYLLSLDNNRVLFETRNGELVKITQQNLDELYDSSNYNGYYSIISELKDGIEKIIDIPINHDNGVIMVDDQYKLVMEWNVPYWENPENYNYYTLVGTLPLDDTNLVSIIKTKYGNFIKTNNGSYIKTKLAYEPIQDVQYITDINNNKLNTMDNYDIIRKETTGVIYFYLLNDEYKFGQDIVTKYDKTIITKRKEYSIIKKKQDVYKYINKKLLDIDIIVEYIKQENILDTLLPVYVDKLRHNTSTYIEGIQKCVSPVILDLDYCKRYSYRFDGYDYPIRFSNTQIFMCNNIPWTKKRKSPSILIESIATLVVNEEVRPFFIFIDGKIVKWSNIVIVRDWKFSYIILNNTPENDSRIDAIMFPCKIRYGEDNKILPNTPHLYFNKNRLLTENTSEELSVRIEIIDENINHTSIISKGSEKDKTIISVPTRDYDQWSNLNNLFVFDKDGKYVADSRFYLSNLGKNMYYYEFDEKNTIYKTFYYTKYNESKAMLYDIPNQEQVKYDIEEKLDNNEYIPEDNFRAPFDFRLSRDKSYLTNISEATKYIMSYNMSLLVDYYRDQSNIKSYIYTGEHIRNLSAKNKGVLLMPRIRNKTGLFDFVIIFVNDKLYDYNNEIKYKASNFEVPIYNHILNSDKVEIIHFNNVDNNYSSIIINDELDYLNENLRYDNFLLFGNSESGRLTYPEFSVENNEQYMLEFEYKNNFSEYNKYLNTSIKLEDFYFYNRKINIASKKQFRSMYYNVLKDKQDEFKLNPEFRFCQFSNQYMIYVNGLKLNQDDWQLLYPTHNIPRKDISIKLNSSLKLGDKIDIIYIPTPYEEIILKNNSNKFGDIILDASNLDYVFDNELFLIFIDGNKILKDNIQNISSNRVRIKNKTTWNEVCICKYLNPDRILQKVFSYGDLWSKSVNGLSNSDYEKLFIKSGVKK